MSTNVVPGNLTLMSIAQWVELHKPLMVAEENAKADMLDAGTYGPGVLPYPKHAGRQVREQAARLQALPWEKYIGYWWEHQLAVLAARDARLPINAEALEWYLANYWRHPEHQVRFHPYTRKGDQYIYGE